jgi:2,3,4,5-tetrahydropyridine-2-carboxylate N-succinyltransferase
MDAVEQVIAELNTGRLRVATREGCGPMDRPPVDQKRPCLLSFRLKDNVTHARR